MFLEDRLNTIAKAEFSRIKEPLPRIYCLRDSRFDANVFCNEVERVFEHDGKNVMKVFKFCILGIPTDLPPRYVGQIIDDIIALDDFLKDNTRYNK